MNWKLTRFASIIMAVLFVMILSLPVFAADVIGVESWTSGGIHYQAVFVKTETVKNMNVDVLDTLTQHTQGTTTHLGGYHVVTTYGDTNFPSAYKTRLTSAASAAGITLPYNHGFTFTTITIPASAPTGMYCIKTTVTGRQGQYRVEKIGSSSTTTLVSGTFNCAPTNCSGNSLLHSFILDP